MVTGVTVFLLLVIAILAVPVTLIFRVSWPAVADNDIQLQWAFGLVRARLPVVKTKSRVDKTEKAKKRIRRRAAPQRKRNVVAAIRMPRFRRRVVRFASDLWHAIYKDNVRVRARIGLGDPADTGQLWAVLGPVAVLLGSGRAVSIWFEPDFLQEEIDVGADGRIRVVPLQMVYLAGALLLSPSIWRGIRRMTRSG